MMRLPVLLQLLDAGGAPTATLHLPTPMEGYPQTLWVADEVRKQIPGRGLRVRSRGFRPVIKIRWKYYDDRPGRYAIGTSDGQRPSLAQFLDLISRTGGRYRVGQPGAWVTVEVADPPEPNPVSGYGANVTVTFHGRHALPTMTLEA